LNFAKTRAKLIKRVHDSIPFHIQRLSWSKHELLKFQTTRLRNILETANNRSPYYREILKGFDLNSFELDDLSKLPVLKKDTVMENWDSFVTVEGINRKTAEDHLEKLRDGKTVNPYFDNRDNRVLCFKKYLFTRVP